MANDSPRCHWDQLLPQAELTLNLLRQARVQPEISAWDFLMGPFNYDATPLGPLGCPVMIHKNTSNRTSRDFHIKEVWSVGVYLEHYRCQLVIPADTRETNVSDTVEFLNKFITYPNITPEYRILHGLNMISGTIKDAPTATYNAQIKAITTLHDICTGWSGNDTLANMAPSVQPPCKSHVHEPIVQSRRYPRVKEGQQNQRAHKPTRAIEENNPPGKDQRVHF